jgi:2-methylisocitrate lyase-like PEP mutase family enzyme
VESFRSLHAAGRILVLPNAWDAGSARVIEACGARAIAITSAGLAWSRGHADGHQLPPSVLARAVEEIARVLSIPLSVDELQKLGVRRVSAGAGIAHAAYSVARASARELLEKGRYDHMLGHQDAELGLNQLLKAERK